MISGILLISIFAGITTSALAFYALKASWGFSMAEFRNALANLFAVPDMRPEPEVLPLVGMYPVTDRSASVFLVYSLMEVPHNIDVASAWEGNYAPLDNDGLYPGVCKFYLN